VANPKTFAKESFVSTGSPKPEFLALENARIALVYINIVNIVTNGKIYKYFG
jgi:hypothetical protein